MTLLDAIRYRAMKIGGNSSKVLFSLHLTLFPRQRRQIPAHLAPSSCAPQRRIPRIVWQTNYTRSVTRQVFMCFRFNRLLTRNYAYNLFDDAQCDRFVAENYPGEINEAYRRLTVGAARADFWRVLVLLRHGGIYLDMDANFSDLPDRHIDAAAETLFIAMNNGEVTNYFIASAPGDAVLKDVCDRIVRNINEGLLKSVYDLTGPRVLDAAVKAHGVQPLNYKKICVQGQFVNKRGQYIDKPGGDWMSAQTSAPIISAKDENRS
jgi:mannosyltransferase OCH1-like enzyme